MKHTLLFSILVFIFITLINAQVKDTSKRDVHPVCELEGRKGLKFGMSFEETRNVYLDRQFQTIDDVLALEPGLTEEELRKMMDEDAINSFLNIHSTSFAGNNATGSLMFSNNRLYSFLYTFEIETSNNNKYIDIYYDLKGLLSKKYGDPTNTSEYLSYPYEEDFPRGNHAGQAVSIGKGKYGSFWICPTNKKSVILGLTGDNYEMSLVLIYSDNSFDISEEEKLSEELEDF